MPNTHRRPGGSTRVVAAILMTLAAAIASPAQTLTTLHSFADGGGLYPYGGLIQATDRNFYGTTVVDSVFKMTASGTVTSLHSFDGTDGYAPYGGLIQTPDGNFYGTTVLGGGNGYCVPTMFGCGTVFKITPSGTLTTLYTFCPQGGGAYCPDGAEPYAGLVQASDGNFYGTTYVGGTNGGYGTVFEITPSGTLTTIHSFDETDGEFPYGALAQGADGNLYGTTIAGGATDNGLAGTVFQITPGGTLTTLHSFCSGSGCPDGANPYAGLVQGTDGNFYGTTEGGGSLTPYGTVFRITPGGALTTLHVFNYTDGASPYGGLLQASDGNFYGTTSDGGVNCGGYDGGTIFRITPSGTLTTLYKFCSEPGSDGWYPVAALIQATDGNLYGTTEYGPGNPGDGTAFRLSPGVPAVGLAPGMLNFGPQGVQAPNFPQNVTLTNTGSAPLTITSIAITGTNSGDFDQWNNCPISPSTLAPGNYCTITVVFAPTETGTLTAAVTITDNASDSPQTVPLTGIGVGGKVRPR
jgi:uncharacterized repeat protein (TIGR03803 family)